MTIRAGVSTRNDPPGVLGTVPVTDVPVNRMMKPVLTMIFFAWLPTLLVTTFVPDVALWLPDLLFGR